MSKDHTSHHTSFVIISLMPFQNVTNLSCLFSFLLYSCGCTVSVHNWCSVKKSLPFHLNKFEVRAVRREGYSKSSPRFQSSSRQIFLVAHREKSGHHNQQPSVICPGMTSSQTCEQCAARGGSCESLHCTPPREAKYC